MIYYSIQLFYSPRSKALISTITAKVIFQREKVQVVAMPIFFFHSYRTNKQNKCA